MATISPAAGVASKAVSDSWAHFHTVLPKCLVAASCKPSEPAGRLQERQVGSVDLGCK